MYRLFCALSASAFVVLLLDYAEASAADRPNIVVILADDFGVGDIQAHYPRNKIPTPHLDRLVRQGVSFTDAHSPSAVCSPTRYGLLTGRYAWRTRLQEWVVAAYEPPLIVAGRPTLPALLRQSGYHSACIGKWHLGWNWAGPQPSRMTAARNGQVSKQWDFTKRAGGGPVDLGFDYFYGVDLPNLPPFTFMENDRVAIQPTEPFRADPSEGVVLPRFKGSPMAPNWKMQKVLPEITKRAVRYIHDRAKVDQPFFLYFSMTSPHEPVVPGPMFRGKSKIAPIADFVMETDWSAGQVIQAIDEAGLAEDTIVIFTADNGHSHYTGWEKLVAAGHAPSGPYRGHKGDIWEGGHRVPLVVRWPNRVAAGATHSQLVSLTDLFATCAELVEAKLPANGAEDSVSFLPAVLGDSKTAERRTTLISHSNHGEFAYRDGAHKLVFKMSGRNLEASRGKPCVVELYDLSKDVGEQADLAPKRPDLVNKLRAKMARDIARGASRSGVNSANDADVRFDAIQTVRWAPARNASAN